MNFFPGCKYSYIVVAAADILMFIVGTASAWSSPMLPKLQNSEDNPLGRVISQDEASWIGSLLSMGGIVSPLIWGYMTQKVGRKTGSLLVAIPFFIAFLTSAFAETIELYYFSRVLMGIGIGGMFCILPIYVVEVAEDANRGLLTASTGSFLVAGMLFTYAIGPFVNIMIFNLILTGLCLSYVVVFWMLAPETPYYLIQNGDYSHALSSLMYLRRRPLKELEDELSRIKLYLSSMHKSSFLNIFESKASIKAFLYSVTLTTLQQFSGINVIFSYMQNIFDLTGSNIAPEICAIIVASVQLVSSFISPLLSDKAGRRTLLLVSICGATAAEIILGAYFYLNDHGSDTSKIKWLPLFSMVLFMMFYNFGMGSLPWAIMPELLPSNVIAKASLIITCTYWLVGWVLTQYFASLTDEIGAAGSFWLFSCFCIVFGLFVFACIFETKGKSLQEIQQILGQ